MDQIQNQNKLEKLSDHAFETVFIIGVRFATINEKYGECTILKIWDKRFANAVYEAYTYSKFVKEQISPLAKEINENGRVYKAIINKEINYMSLIKIQAIGYTEGGLES
jgi:hypothetical protein